MKTADLFLLIFRQTKMKKFLISFVVVFLVCSVLMLIFDPDMKNLGDAIWFGFMLVTTTGFGDLTVAAPMARIVAVFLGLYGIVFFGFITGVGASWLFEKVRDTHDESVAHMLYQLEHLDELSDDEISSLQKKAAALNNKPTAKKTVPQADSVSAKK